MDRRAKTGSSCTFGDAGGVRCGALRKPKTAAVPFIALTLRTDVNHSAGIAAKLGFVIGWPLVAAAIDLNSAAMVWCLA
jgi:hypothetical protein